MKRLLLFLAVFLLVTGFAVSPAQGQDGSIVLKSKEIRNQFPDGVEFSVVAETVAPEKIQEIKLEMGVKGSSRTSYAYLEFTPATSVQGKYLLRTGGAQYKPPGTLIEYRFVITDSKGRTLDTPLETYLYLDNRFEWEKVSQGTVEVYYYGPTKTRAELILKASTETVTRMGGLLGVTPSQTIRVIAYNNPTHMAEALPFQSKVMQTQLLTQGQAWYEYDILLVLGGDSQADGVASHEVTHMLVREAAKGAFVDLPTWLNEGLAEYGNINPGYSYDELLNEAIATNKLLRVRQMQAMPGLSREILLFYGQARSVVRFMVNTYGEAKIRDLFAAFRQGLRIDEALKKAYGFDQDGLDNAWRQSLGLPQLAPAPAITPTPTPQLPPPPEKPTTQPAPPPRANRWAFGCAGPAR